jgi:formylglycine-generating enzyme required for sulfatase activity
MIGNVWQWCDDSFGAYDKDAAIDPVGAAARRARVVRGGSWNRLPARCRPAHRGPGDPAHRDNNYGFRVVVADR